ncbi:hypothetical protein LQ948_05850 [Jiella sp. MQZ9-1]|uniref:Uncharacterized protein n=1 Tax=Jiella flava TaxID=2816857 RepID=A0A939FU15_9HYPH|nr:hypothetical protein [Jiella flava]MBO0661943.1 hypothetical protein [Jiella flava]MCD2470729.1 hypothetical protein [Jiella flava]
MVGDAAREDMIGARSLMTPEEKLFAAMFGETTPEVSLQGARESSDEADLFGQRELWNALDAISENLEHHVANWNLELDEIEEDLARSIAPGRQIEVVA